MFVLLFLFVCVYVYVYVYVYVCVCVFPRLLDLERGLCDCFIGMLSSGLPLLSLTTNLQATKITTRTTQHKTIKQNTTTQHCLARILEGVSSQGQVPA